MTADEDDTLCQALQEGEVGDGRSPLRVNAILNGASEGTMVVEEGRAKRSHTLPSGNSGRGPDSCKRQHRGEDENTSLPLPFGNPASSGSHSVIQSASTEVDSTEVGSQTTNTKYHVQKEYQILLAQATCLEYCKDRLFMRDDNLINFISKDVRFVSPVTLELQKEGRICLSEIAKFSDSLAVGKTCYLPTDKKKVFHLVIKEKPEDPTNLEVFESCLISMKTLMDDLKITTVSFPLHRHSLGLTQQQLERTINKVFSYSYRFTLCTDEIIFPKEDDLEAIFYERHDAPASGHPGVNRTYKHIRKDYYWPGIWKDVQSYVKTCKSCQENKLTRLKTRQPLCITDTPKRAFDKIQMDIVGPLPITESGTRYLLTIQCNLTKYADAIPIPAMDSVTIGLAFAKEFIMRHGCPGTVHTDQGRNFLSKVTKVLCQTFKIQQIKSTAFHPESLGSLERAHHVFIEHLKHYCDKRNWDEFIRFCIFSYNTLPSSSLGNKSPHELVYGREAVIPSEFAKEQVPYTFVDLFDDLFQKITTAQATAAENLQLAKERCKYYYDKHIHPQNFAVDEMVYVLKNKKDSKFDPHWMGPYKILQVFNDRNVQIQISPNKTKVVHSNKLKLACIRPECLPPPHLF